MAIAVFSLFSVAAFLCGSKKAKRLSRRWEKKSVRLGNGKTAVKRVQSSLSSKALLLAKMVSWRKVQNEEEEEDEENRGFDYCDEDEGAVWRKTIIKGEKCRPLDFSGKILYDSDGNLIPDSSPHRPQSQ